MRGFESSSMDRKFSIDVGSEFYCLTTAKFGYEYTT